MLSDRTLKINIPCYFMDRKPQESNVTFSEEGAPEWSQQAQLENRIRKERESMERQIRERMVQRKIETATPPEQYRLSKDYIKGCIDKRQYY